MFCVYSLIAGRLSQLATMMTIEESSLSPDDDIADIESERDDAVDDDFESEFGDVHTSARTRSVDFARQTADAVSRTTLCMFVVLTNKFYFRSILRCIIVCACFCCVLFCFVFCSVF